MLVVQLTMSAWRLLRSYRSQIGFMTYKLKSTSELANLDKLRDDTDRQGLATTMSLDTLTLLGRTEGRLERTFFRCLHELQRLRAARPVKAEIGSVLQKKPKPAAQPPEPEIAPVPAPAPPVSQASPDPDPAPKPITDPDH